ncbi:hypothetical protein L0991_03695 [Vibrio chagasii]|uniref:hypothetical protein n=1 Tax=Vibrio chagasii TaxID=170679 RepID=UPI0035A6FA87
MNDKDNLKTQTNNNTNKGNNCNKKGFFTSILTFFVCLLLSPFRFLRFVHTPQIKVISRTFNKCKKFDIRYTILFFVCFIFFFAKNISASPTISQIELPIISESLAFLFGNENIGTINESYIPAEANVYIGLLKETSDALANGLFLALFIWFLAQTIISATLNEFNVHTAKRAFIALICIIFMNITFEREVMLENGQEKFISEETTIPTLFQTFFADTFLELELFVTDKENETFKIQPIKVISPEHFALEFYDFTNTYLLGIETSDKLTDTLSIEYNAEQYRVEFAMGGITKKYTFNENVRYNQESTSFKFDLKKLEKELVIDYFQAMIAHAQKVKDQIENVEFTGFVDDGQTANFQNGFNKSFESIAFENPVISYCPTIYDYDLTGADEYTLQRFMQVAASCASIDFFTKQYKSDDFDIYEVYTDNYILDNRYALLYIFDELENNDEKKILSPKEFTWNKLVSKADKYCDYSYLLCAEMIKVLVHYNPDYRDRLGALYGVLDIVKDPVNLLLDGSDDLLQSRSIESSTIANLSYLDFVNEDTAIENIKFTLNREQKKELVFDNLDLLNLEHLFIPSLQQIFKSVYNTDLTSPFQRMITCLNYPNQLKNGVMCDTTTNEFMMLNASAISTGLTIYIGSTAQKLLPISDGVGGIVIGGASKLAKTAAHSASIATAVVTPIFANQLVKENPYSAQETAQTLLTSSYILSFFKLDFSQIFSLLGSLLISSGFSGISLIYWVKIYFWLYIFSRIFEFIIDSNLFWLIAFKETVEEQEYGLIAIAIELFVETIYIAVLVMFALDLPDIHDRMLYFILSDLSESLNLMSLSISNFVSEIVPFTFKIVFYCLLMIGTLQVLLAVSENTITEAKQNIKT